MKKLENWNFEKYLNERLETKNNNKIPFEYREIPNNHKQIIEDVIIASGVKKNNNEDDDENEDNNIIELIKLVDLKEYELDSEVKPKELFYDKEKKRFSIKLRCNKKNILKNIHENFINKASFSSTKSKYETFQEIDLSNDNNNEFDFSFPFHIINKIIINKEEDNYCQIAFELNTPPSNRTKFFKGETEQDFQDTLFPFRDFNSEFSNLKYRNFYFVLKIKSFTEIDEIFDNEILKINVVKDEQPINLIDSTSYKKVNNLINKLILGN